MTNFTRSHMTTLLPTLLVAASMLAIAPESVAQSMTGYRNRVAQYQKSGGQVPFGWFFGVGGSGVAVRGQVGGPERLEGGPGGTIFGGLHLHPNAAVEFSWTESYHNPAVVDTWFGETVDYLVLDGLSISARVYLGRMLYIATPYLVAGVGGYSLSSTNFGLDSTGTGFHVGLGCDFWPTSWWAIGLRLQRRSISFDPPAGASDDFVVTTMGLTFTASAHF